MNLFSKPKLKICIVLQLFLTSCFSQIPPINNPPGWWNLNNFENSPPEQPGNGAGGNNGAYLTKIYFTLDKKYIIFLEAAGAAPQTGAAPQAGAESASQSEPAPQSPNEGGKKS